MAVISLEINNGRALEFTQKKPDGEIKVTEVVHSTGKRNPYCEIAPGNAVMLLNVSLHY